MRERNLLTPLLLCAGIFAVSMFAGSLGALLGLGGGIIIVPALTLMFGVDIRYAIGASIVAVIATSSGAAAAYVRDHMTNLRAAMFLELGTTIGAICGAYLGGIISGRWLFIIFGVIMGYSALVMLRKRQESEKNVPPDALADKLQLHGEYFDAAENKQVKYKVTGTKAGLSLMWLAGVVSGLLGIGSGALKVPAMDLAMRLPIKVSSATSNFMIGVTAAASAGIYFVRGDINPLIAAPVAAGVMVGATISSRILPRLHSRIIRVTFVVVLLWISGQMLLKGIRG